MYKRKQQRCARIALERVKELFRQASIVEDRKLQNRYVQLARKIQMKCKIKMPKLLKRKYCSHCYAFLIAPRVRINRGKVTIYCPDCKRFTRIPLKPGRKAVTPVVKKD